MIINVFWHICPIWIKKQESLSLEVEDLRDTKIIKGWDYIASISKGINLRRIIKDYFKAKSKNHTRSL